jgi:hypothetical protein
VGLIGKSDYATFLLARIKAIPIKGGEEQIAISLAKVKKTTGFYPKICVLDIPRNQETEIDYIALEILKTGNLSGSKYTGQTVLITRPHMVFFGNFELPEHALSSDQLLNLEIDPKTKDFVNPEAVQQMLDEDILYAHEH